MTEPLAALWIVSIVLIPLLLPILIILTHNTLSMVGIPDSVVDSDRFQFGLSVVTLLAITATFLLTYPRSLPFGFAPIYLLFFPAGFVVYHTESILRTGRWNTSGTRSLDNATRRAALLAGIALTEELLFRGGLSGLIDAIGPVGFLVVSAGAFGTAHGMSMKPEKVLYKTVFGGVLAVVFLGTGSLLPPMITHLGYNSAYVQRRSSLLADLDVTNPFDIR